MTRKYLTTVRRKRKENTSKEGIFVVERRKDPRVSVELPLDYSLMDVKATYEGIGANGSEGGLLAYLPEPIEIGGLLEIEILFVRGSEQNTIKGTAKVVWSDLAAKESWGQYRYGLEFQSFHEGDLHKLKVLLKEIGKAYDSEG